MISRTVAIGSSVGLHARPASVLAEAVDDSGVEVTIAFDGESPHDTTLQAGESFGTCQPASTRINIA